MARGKGGLGRGLDSLFEDAAPVFESEHAAVEMLPLREIEPDPDQPRKTFEQETLSELAASIAEHGLLQPIAVRPRPMAVTASWQASAAGAPPAWRVLLRCRWSSRMCPTSRPWSWRW